MEDVPGILLSFNCINYYKDYKDYNVMIDGRNFFDHPDKNDIRKYVNIVKFAPGSGYDCRTCCLLDYSYLKENYKLIEMDVSKQQALYADPKSINKLI